MADQEKDQKTEEATPRRREEAREKGQVAISTELIAAMALCVGLASMTFGGGVLIRALGTTIVQSAGGLPRMGATDLGIEDVSQMIKELASSVGGALALVVAPPIIISALVGYGQVGLRFAPKALEVDPSKLDPIKGAGKIFGLRGFVRTAMAAAKVLFIATVVAAIAWSHVGGLIRVGNNEIGPLLVGIGHLAIRCTVGALVVIVILGLIDLLYQRFQLSRDLRMTKQEVRDEHRITEGDPHVRARVRSIQREMATRRMMDDVPEATVVVTNPTHYAVALKYEAAGEDQVQAAPICVAKGVDSVAQRIKQVAKEHEVVCYEDVPLARALHAQVEVGQEIPEDLYSAVATVIGYVFRLQGKKVS